MKLKSFNQALALSVEIYTEAKKRLPEYDNFFKTCSPDSVYEKKTKEYSKFRTEIESFFLDALPKFIKNNKIKGEKLDKLTKVLLKTMKITQLNGYDSDFYCYFNKTNMKDESILKDLIEIFEARKSNYSITKKLLFEYNFEYLANHIIENYNIDAITEFAIEQKDNKKLNSKKFENKILNEGSFKNLYDYLYEVKNCNQKAFLIKILEIATLEELKEFSCADEDRAKILKAKNESYSFGYTMGFDPYDY